MRNAMMRGVLAVVMMMGSLAFAAQEGETIQLPQPQMTGGMPLMEALAARRSERAFSDKALSDQVLANLLWAAFGVNRPDSGKRTAPSAVNWQEIDLYVALPGGCYLYDAKANALKRVLEEDVRAVCGRAPFFKTAPVALMYVADAARMGTRASEKDKEFYSATDTGFISQNVYLFAASEGLSTVVVGMVDRPALAAKLGLRPEQKVILTQPVGYPKPSTERGK